MLIYLLSTHQLVPLSWEYYNGNKSMIFLWKGEYIWVVYLKSGYEKYLVQKELTIYPSIWDKSLLIPINLLHLSLVYCPLYDNGYVGAYNICEMCGLKKHAISC